MHMIPVLGVRFQRLTIKLVPAPFLLNVFLIFRIDNLKLFFLALNVPSVNVP
jgi:hypothetical protein